jgi:hypothetical protein
MDGHNPVVQGWVVLQMGQLDRAVQWVAGQVAHRVEDEPNQVELLAYGVDSDR